MNKSTKVKITPDQRRIVVLEAEVARLQAVADEQGARAAKAENALADAKTKLESAERSQKYHIESASSAKNKLDQIDGFLDALPNPPARKVEGEYGNQTVVDTVSRLMTYIATRG